MSTGLVRPDHHPAADTGGPIAWARMRRILAVRTDNLGDLVMLTPALRALRAAAPQARLDLLTSCGAAAAASVLPAVDTVLGARIPWQQVGSVAVTELATTQRHLLGILATGCYDAMVVFTSPTQSPWPAAQLGALAGIPVRALHSTEFGGALASHWVTPPSMPVHQVDRSLHLLAALGVPDAGRHLELVVPPVAQDRPRGPVALLVPGGSAPAKRYPAERFAAVAASIASAGIEVQVSGTAAEHATVRSIVDAVGRASVHALEPVPFPGFVAQVAAADVVLCNNSAAMHVADAVGTPVVVTYAGTERLSDMPPRSAPSRLLQQAVPCSPCRQFQCPYEHQCLDIDPEDVASAALSLLRSPLPVP